MPWWRDAVVYQIYPRSFQDSDGDGVGDLAGLESRLDHVAQLGASAVWVSPIYPSPLADFGYDVSDYEAVDPVYGDLEGFDRLLAAVHERGMRLLMDLVPCHTSIEHRWFDEHPDWYIWADGRDGGPPNNWLSTFGGPAWTRHEGSGRWYLHSYYPEQPDLDWRNPELVRAMQDVIRFWLDRGVDGFRIDAIDRLVKDSELRDDPPASAPFALPLPEEYARLEHLYSTNSPDIRAALDALREAAGDALLVGEVYLPAAESAPYLDQLDAVFAFELFHSPWEAGALTSAIEACAALAGDAGVEGPAWVLSNHDFPRLPSRAGEENARAAAVLLLTLPGLAFIYQGEEIGQADGPGGERVYDRAGRDAHRHPMQWEPDPVTGGFTTGSPWLAPVDPERRSVSAQSGQADSMLELYRALIALRRDIRGPVEMVAAGTGIVAYRRGRHLVAVNTTAAAQPLPEPGQVLLESVEGAVTEGELAPNAAVVGLADG
jgi:alpha-glucosidase